MNGNGQCPTTDLKTGSTSQNGLNRWFPCETVSLSCIVWYHTYSSKLYSKWYSFVAHTAIKENAMHGKWVSLKYWTFSNSIFIPPIDIDIRGGERRVNCLKNCWKENILHNWSHGVASSLACESKESAFLFDLFLFFFSTFEQISSEFGVDVCIHDE